MNLCTPPSLLSLPAMPPLSPPYTASPLLLAEQIEVKRRAKARR